MAMLRFATMALAAIWLSACTIVPDWLKPESGLEVNEIGRSLFCNTPDAQTRAWYFADLDSLRRWLDARKLRFDSAGALTARPYAVVELGQRRTGGYSLAVSRRAELATGVVRLHATFIAPAPGQLTAQAITSPCVLVALPQGRYRGVEVVDQDGERRADSLTPAKPEPAQAGPSR